MFDAIDNMLGMIKRGLQGLNIGLSMGLPRLEKVMDGIQRQTYTIITGGTGSGKTTLALHSYVYRPICDHFGDMKFRVLYFSFEMKAEILLAKILSLHIFETYGIVLSYKDIMSRQEILSEEMFQLVESCIPWLRDFHKQITIIDKTMNANEVYDKINEYAMDNGVLEEMATSIKYTPHIKDELVVIILDHAGLLNLMTGQNKKEAMDRCSKNLMVWRNICGYSPLVLLQLNRGANSMDRVKENRQEIELSDIKDSSGPSEDAEVILAIFHPHREKLGKHKDFDIRRLKDRYRAVQILKSRLGEADKTIGINFFGEIGLWRELPKAEELREANDIEFEKYLTLKPSGLGVTKYAKEVKAKENPPAHTFKFKL